jgi:hypothetical protein
VPDVGCFLVDDFFFSFFGRNVSVLVFLLIVPLGPCGADPPWARAT